MKLARLLCVFGKHSYMRWAKRPATPIWPHSDLDPLRNLQMHEAYRVRRCRHCPATETKPVEVRTPAVRKRQLSEAADARG